MYNRGGGIFHTGLKVFYCSRSLEETKLAHDNNIQLVHVESKLP